MKKLLALLSFTTLTVPVATSVVSCGGLFGSKGASSGGKIVDHLVATDFSTLSYKKLDDLIGAKYQDLWETKCKIGHVGSIEGGVLDKHPKLAKTYTKVVFNAIAARTKVFLETDYVIMSYDDGGVDVFYLQKANESEKSYQECVEGTKTFLKARATDDLMQFYDKAHRDYLKWCDKQLTKLLK